MAKEQEVKAEPMENKDLMQVGQQSMAIATTRAAQEVQAAMVIAKKFPRNTIQAEKRIVDACKRKSLAEVSQYVYPRGDTTVHGPSIRLAEVLAQNWGNIDTGIIELEQSKGESTMMAYCWDLETNTRQTKVFTVKHERHTRSGHYSLKDPRDIYEMTANQGARRQRACILGVIPGDIVDRAVAECNKTLRGDQTKPIIDRAKKMVKAFEVMNVTQDMIEKRLGHRLETISETELLNLRKIWTAINDNMQSAEAYFGSGTQARETGSIDVDQTIGKATEATTEPGGTKETAPQPNTADTAPVSDVTEMHNLESETQDNETNPLESETPEPEDDAPEPSAAPQEAPDPSDGQDDEDTEESIVDKIKAAWRLKLAEKKGFVDAPYEFVERQIENFCVNFWAQMPFAEVCETKPGWLPKLLGFIETGQIPSERYAFELKQAMNKAGQDKPKRPGRPRKNK